MAAWLAANPQYVPQDWDGQQPPPLPRQVAARAQFNGAWGSRSGMRRVAGYELSAALAVSLLSRFAVAAAAAGATPPVCASAVRLGALQWLLQGWDITAAIIELTQRNAALVGASHLLVAVMVRPFAHSPIRPFWGVAHAVTRACGGGR